MSNHRPAESIPDPGKDQFQSRPGDDERFIARALALAAQGINTTHPNPRVGCVVVKNGTVVGEGWHRFAGEDHAEIIALKQAGNLARGATMYVTLEPCSHHGRTPPCTNAVIKSGISRAVIAVEDPNPLVNRAGISALQRAGLDVVLGIGKQPARRLNRGFFKRAQRNFSHGCIRVAKPLDLAEFVLTANAEWTPNKIQSSINSRKTKTVHLNQTIPVYILYFTSWVDDQGNVNFHKDIYGLDQTLLNALRTTRPNVDMATTIQ